MEYVLFSPYFVPMCWNTVPNEINFVLNLLLLIIYNSSMFQYVPFFVNLFLYYITFFLNISNIVLFCCFFALLLVLNICSSHKLVPISSNVVPNYVNM